MDEARIAVVIGGSRGIGAAIAERLAATATVLLSYSGDAAGAEAAVERIAAGGGRASAVRADVRDRAAIEALFEAVRAQHGRIDILVNNAGISGAGPLIDLGWDAIGEVLDVNLRGTLYCIARAAPLFPASGGAIINLGSALAQQPVPGQALYAASKAGIEAVTRVAAQELGPRGIRVNAIAPGPVDTVLLGADEATKGFLASRAALGRIAVPGDIAAIAAFLASDEARWITGQVIGADGGLRL